MYAGDEVRYSFVDVQGRDDAPTLIALPSGPGFCHRTLSPWLAGLAEIFRVATVDLPGCGHGSLSKGLEYGFQSYIADLDIVLNKLGVEHAALLGHGWGAAMAVEYALACPSAVGSLVLVNPIRIFTSGGQDSGAQARMIERTNPDLVEQWVQNVAPAFQTALAGETEWDAVERHSWWGRMVLTQFAAPPPPAWNAAMQGEAWRLRAYATYKGVAMFDPASEMARYDLAKRAASLSTPTLILASNDDANYVAPLDRHAIPLADTMAGARLLIWAGVGHFPFVEKSKVFCRTVGEFLRRSSGPVSCNCAPD